MELKHLSDEELHSDILKLVKSEREILTDILHHLMEAEWRRLHSKHNQPSIHEYAVLIGYTDDQATRRIAAMRLLRECPAIEEKIQSAELGISHMLKAKQFFRKEKKAGRAFSARQKEEVLEAMCGRSVRDAEKIAQTFSPEPQKKTTTVKLELTDEILEALQQLKGLRAHTDGGMTDSELFEKLVAEDIARRTADPKSPRKDSKAELRREVYRRDGHKCTDCGSQYALEIDHLEPASVGGEDSLANLRTLCRSCNQRRAIEFFGQAKMDPYINLKTAPSPICDPARSN